jgi:hypothetical protein
MIAKKLLTVLNNKFQLIDMYKLFFLLLAATMMTAGTSCLTSLQPVATSKTIAKDNRLKGSWTNGSQTYRIEELPESHLLRDSRDGGKMLSIGKGSDNGEDSIFFANSYAVTTVKDGVEYIMTGTLSRIDDQLFIDFMSIGLKDAQAGTDNGSGFEFNTDYLPTFSIAQLSFEGKDKLVLKFLNGDFIKEQIIKGNLRLKHERNDLFNSICGNGFFLRSATVFGEVWA